MAITLYYAPHTRAGRVRWLLEEMGTPHDLHRIDFAGKQHRHPEFRTVHPLNKVPALDVDGRRMIESGAMLVYLADRFGLGTLAPALDAPDRGAYLQWIFYAAVTLEPPLLDAYEARDVPEERALAVAAFDAAAQVVVDALADGREYLLGTFTTADIAVGHPLGWARHYGLLDKHPSLVEYGRRVASRPAAKAARAD